MSVTKKQRQTDRPKKKSGSATGAPWKGFVEVGLSDADKTELKAQDVELEAIYEEIDKVVTDGYKVSFGMDKDGVTCRATLMDVQPDSPYAGYALSGRGRDPRHAFASVIYKHRVLLPDGWGAALEDTSAPEFG